MTLLVVRHSWAGYRDAWDTDDRLRPLDAKGRRQAAGLVTLLSEYPVARVLSSPFRRCVETVAPLADARGLEVDTDDRLAEGTAFERVLDLLWEVGDDDTVLCSHGDVISALVVTLPDLGVADLPRRLRWKKGSTWVLEVGRRRITGARYLPPP